MKKENKSANFVKKAVIPVAGLGTRMLPATKAVPKEMLPLVDKPLIQYIVDECIDAGINDIILVTHSSKNSIENHFDTSFELETMLEARVKRQLLKEIQSIIPEKVTISSVRQGLAKGLAHAIMCAYPLVGDEPFAVLLPDVIIKNLTDKKHENKNDLKYMLDEFMKNGRSQVMVEEVERELISSYGVVDCKNVDLNQLGSARLYGIVEKPATDDAPSNFAVVGRYVLSEKIWPLLKETPVGTGGEIQLTDSISMLLKQENMDAYLLKSKSYDCGNKIGYTKAFISHALELEGIKDDIREWIKSII